MSAPYIGPERRKGQRREAQVAEYCAICGLKRDAASHSCPAAGYGHEWVTGPWPVRRPRTERRQEALAGVLVGFNATDMLVLGDLWRQHEARQHGA